MNLPDQTAASLRDIHLPDAVSWWPPAIGWWIVLALIIASVIFIPKLYRRATYTPLKKVANDTFMEIIKQHKKNNNGLEFVVNTSQFLRQTAMSYTGREQVAQLTGDKWVQALNNISVKKIFTDSLKQSLIDAPYQKDSSVNTEQLINAVQEWLANLPKQTSKGLNK